jgi:hypothetical protein
MSDPEDIAGDLRSRQRERVERAVAQLERCMLALEPVPLPPPPADLFDVLDDDADNDDLIASYLGVLGTYPFEPPLTPTERTRRAVDAVIGHGRSYAARTLSLKLVLDNRYEGPGQALRLIADQGAAPGREAEAAAWLLSYLLDDVDTRPDTISGLRSWLGKPVLQDIVDATEADSTDGRRGR